jgi:hypothetical protein
MGKQGNPPEFNLLTAFFLPWAEQIYSTIEEQIDDGWRSLTPKQQAVARDYLDSILSDDNSETQLREIWAASNAALKPIRGRRGNCRKLFELIRARYEVVSDPIPPPKFEGFWVCLGIALNQDALDKLDFDQRDKAIENGLDWCEQDDLAALRDFLLRLMSRPDAAEQMSKLQERTYPRINFGAHPDAPSGELTIVQFFARVLALIEKRLI